VHSSDGWVLKGFIGENQIKMYSAIGTAYKQRKEVRPNPSPLRYKDLRDRWRHYRDEEKTGFLWRLREPRCHVWWPVGRLTIGSTCVDCTTITKTIRRPGRKEQGTLIRQRNHSQAETGGWLFEVVRYLRALLYHDVHTHRLLSTWHGEKGMSPVVKRNTATRLKEEKKRK
jgi:hypothetical protein